MAAVVFDGFELLDLAGPLEVLGLLKDAFEIRLVGPGPGPVRSNQGPAVLADEGYPGCPPADLLLVPGGPGARRLVDDRPFLAWLEGWAARAELVSSVCTGSAVLAAAGLLDGYRATSNKEAFEWVREQGPGVQWVAHARWVHDRDRWTSSGVAAGIDMSLALVSALHGEELASRVADVVEHDWNREAGRDPFAAKLGLPEP